MSAQATSPMPPPSAWPLHACDHRLGDRSRSSRTWCGRRPRRRRSARGGGRGWRASSRCRRRPRRRCRRRSAPSRASRPWPAPANICVSCAISDGPIAFRTSGRLMVEGRDRAVCVSAGSRSHPEHPVGGVGGPGAGRGGQAQRQQLARVAGVDDAVVPEPRGRVPGRALALVVVDDRAPRTRRARRRSSRRGRSTARARPGGRPSPRCGRSATSRAGGASRRGRTWRSCRRRSCRRSRR